MFQSFRGPVSLSLSRSLSLSLSLRGGVLELSRALLLGRVLPAEMKEPLDPVDRIGMVLSFAWARLRAANLRARRGIGSAKRRAIV